VVTGKATTPKAVPLRKLPSSLVTGQRIWKAQVAVVASYDVIIGVPTLTDVVIEVAARKVRIPGMRYPGYELGPVGKQDMPHNLDLRHHIPIQKWNDLAIISTTMDWSPILGKSFN